MSDRGAVEVFNFHGAPVRTTEIGGEPWWVLADVCTALGIGNSRDVAARLYEGDVCLAPVGTGIPGDSRRNNVQVVSEAGLYLAVLRSDKPKAEPFIRWVTRDVLPSIRQHGMYATPATIDQMLADPDAMIRTLTELKAERARADGLERAVGELTPKAERYDHLVDEAALVSMGQAARILYADGSDVGRGRLFDFIDARLGWLMWERDAMGGRHRVGTQAAQNQGHIEHRLEDVPLGKTGRVMPVTQPFLTLQGFNTVRAEMRRPGVGQIDTFRVPRAGTGETTR